MSLKLSSKPKTSNLTICKTTSHFDFKVTDIIVKFDLSSFTYVNFFSICINQEILLNWQPRLKQ
jgi:hypothetical protein